MQKRLLLQITFSIFFSIRININFIDFYLKFCSNKHNFSFRTRSQNEAFWCRIHFAILFRFIYNMFKKVLFFFWFYSAVNELIFGSFANNIPVYLQNISYMPQFWDVKDMYIFICLLTKPTLFIHVKKLLWNFFYTPNYVSLLPTIMQTYYECLLLWQKICSLY